MTFDDLLGQMQQIKHREIRSQDKDHCEMVFAPDNVKSATAVLEAYFGLPLKPEGKEPTTEAARFADPHGGVRFNQTLYFHKGEKTSELALLWPWGGGSALTLIIVRQPV